ncbi:hypothetical protein FACS189487_02660 [Campylobacterota bacterium]|nr:hypothetical protein FACS189487_02660 [Campylobacterota bacterium]
MKYAFNMLAGFALLGLVGFAAEQTVAQQTDSPEKSWHFGSDDPNPWNAITSVAFSPDGTILVAGDNQGKIRAYSIVR